MEQSYFYAQKKGRLKMIDRNNPSTTKIWKTRCATINAPGFSKPAYIVIDCASDAQFIASLDRRFPGWVECSEQEYEAGCNVKMSDLYNITVR